MIDENITFILFGYTSNQLSRRSSKKILCICNECGKERLVSYNSYRNLCASCAQKGNRNSNFGKHHTEETKLKMSKSKQGMYDGNKNPMFSQHHTEETKRKQSEAVSGEKNYMYGKHHTEKTKHKISKARKGIKHPQWRSRKKLSYARAKANRRKLFSFIPHNKPQKNFHGHHLDFNHVIFIPKEIHISISHSVVNNINMDLINNAACDWYLEYQIIK